MRRERSGELWGDLANHNGRRAIGATSPVATGRDCVLTVDGKAAVLWFTGYRPDGRAGELVGLTASADALRPVQRVERPAGDDGGNLLDYILVNHNPDNLTLADLVDAQCGHIRQGHRDHANCVDGVLIAAADRAEQPSNPLTRCRLDSWVESTSPDGLMGVLRGVSGFGPHESVHRLRALEDTECLEQANDWLRQYGVELHVYDDQQYRSLRLSD